jgi:hypothetical protein
MIRLPGIRILSTVVSSVGEYDRRFDTGRKKDDSNCRISKEPEDENNALCIDPKEEMHRCRKLEPKRMSMNKGKDRGFGEKRNPLLTAYSPTTRF